MGLRHRSIRLRVGILIVVPVLCLIGLYGFAASITLGSALTQAHAKTVRNYLLNPVDNFQTELAAERHLAVLNVASPMNAQLQSELGMQEASTQRALNALSAAVKSPQVADNASRGEQVAIVNLLKSADNLTYVRSEVSEDAISITGTLAAYNAIVAAGFTVLDEGLDAQANVPLVTQALEVVNLDRALQTTLTESDLLTADMTQLKFPASDRIAFATLANQRQTLMNTTVPELVPEYRAFLDSSVTPAISSSLSTLEAAAIATPWRRGPPPAHLVAGMSTFGTYAKALETSLTRMGDNLQSKSQSNADTLFLELILAAGLGLLGTIASIALSLVIGRGLVSQLRELRESALTLAHEKLPDVITQLRAGQPVDVAEYAPGQVETSNEIEQVQHAFSVVQQTAIQSAVDEARLRRGISDVFRNLAGRSQSLLHRQLTLLDGMERRATEPDELEDLFRIDHLTTRMRRHAEGLIILSGETPARGWRQPVPLVDVLRAAVAEVEDYTRVRVLSRTSAAVSGHAVADVIHLIAELAENATVFSPPNTPVRILGDVVGRGFAIEIEDRGLGISQARLDEINANLANPPQFDLSGSDRLGLFIAGQLARRHDIKITLRPSVYGGTTAIVLIPTALVVDEVYERDPALPAGREGSLHQDRNSGRHAALIYSAGLAGNGNGHPAGEIEPDYSGFSLALSGRTASDSEPVVQATPVSDELDARVSTAEIADLGLPVRVRQASLAPQLRDSPPAATPLEQRPGNGSSGAPSSGASSSGAPSSGEPSSGVPSSGVPAIDSRRSAPPHGSRSFGARSAATPFDSWSFESPSAATPADSPSFDSPSAATPTDSASFDSASFDSPSAPTPTDSPSFDLPSGGIPTDSPSFDSPSGVIPTDSPSFDSASGVAAFDSQSSGSASAATPTDSQPLVSPSAPAPSDSASYDAPSFAPRFRWPDGLRGQLDSSSATSGGGMPPAAPAASPEAARDTMSALQRGWQLGRAEAERAFDRPTEAAGTEHGDPDDGTDERDNE
jgi:signal transduction histidine kinase